MLYQNSANGSHLCFIRLKLVIGFINPGTLGDRLSRQGSAQEDGLFSSGPARESKFHRPEHSLQALAAFGPSFRSEHQLRLRPTPNGLSDRSASGRPRLPSHDLHSESQTRGLPPTPTPCLRPRFIENPAYCYYSTGALVPTGAIRPGMPSQKEPEGVRRKARQGSQVKPRHQGPYPAEQYFTTTLP